MDREDFLRLCHARLRPYGVLEGGVRVSCHKLVLATGMEDVPPEIEGVEKFWGKSFAHCPYCHGFEHRNEPLAVYGKSERAFHKEMMLTQSSDDIVFLTDGSRDLDGEEAKKRSALGIEIEEEKVASRRASRVETALERAVFESGRSIERRGIFGRPAQRQRSDLARGLGCEFTEDGVVKVEPDGAAGVPGLYVAGDAMRNPHLQEVLSAVVSGATVAVAIINRLLMEDLDRKLSGEVADSRG